MLAIITEAQGVEDFAWEGLPSCATGTDDRVLAVGNPLSLSGRFNGATRRPGWHAIQVSAFDHPNLREGCDVILGGPSRSFVERIAREYGRGSGIYRAQVEGEFPDTDDEGLFRRAWLEAAAERWDPKAGGKIIVAVDPARYGPDATCVAVMRGTRCAGGPRPNGKIRIEDKAELKGRLRRGPDRADAVTMAVWAAVDADPFAVSDFDVSLLGDPLEFPRNEIV